MNTYSIFDIEVEPTGDDYSGLLSAGAQICDSFGCVIRPGEPLLGSVADMLTALGPFLISDEMMSEWPGTRLLGKNDKARVLRYLLNGLTLDTLDAASDRLYAWEHPRLPEDLFLERGSVPWLTSIAHERAAFITMTSEEANALRSRLPSIELTVRLLDSGELPD
jgi:hypothetical protein